MRTIEQDKMLRGSIYFCQGTAWKIGKHKAFLKSHNNFLSILICVFWLTMVVEIGKETILTTPLKASFHAMQLKIYRHSDIGTSWVKRVH